MRQPASFRYVGPPGWRRIPPATRATLVLTALGYLAGLLFPTELALLSAVPARILPGLELWRLVTYPIVNVGIISVLFDLLLLWSFGSQLEPEWGSKGYSLFLVLAALSGGVLGVAAALTLGGFGIGFGFAGPLTAVIVAWMLQGPNLPASFFGVLPMTRKGFAAIAIVVVAFGELEQTRSLSRLVFVLGGLPVAFLWSRRRRSAYGGWTMRTPRFLRRRKLRAVENENRRVH
jgi:membrane associated rhomboid family serine protease